MLPAEKAKSLVDKFADLNQKTDTCFGICEQQPVEVCDHNGHRCGLQKVHAKQCAIICVEEIIEGGPFHSNGDKSYKETYNDYLDAAKEYWVKVKEQIKLL